MSNQYEFLYECDELGLSLKCLFEHVAPHAKLMILCATCDCGHHGQMRDRSTRRPVVVLRWIRQSNSANENKGRREVSTLPTQALFLLNNTFVVQQSLFLAERVLAAGSDGRERVRQAYRSVFARDPQSRELEESLGFVEATERDLETVHPEPEQRRATAWAAFCQTLLASNEMRYTD